MTESIHTPWLLWIPLLPLLGALLNGLVGRWLKPWLVSTIGCATVGLSFVLSLWIGTFVITSHGKERFLTDLYSWIQIAGLDGISLSIRLVVDSLSSVMVLVVTGVSFLIHIYSIGYMKGDPGYARYFSYLNLFVFSMLVLILGDSLPVLFIGWEGVGLCSYLLIGFWFEDTEKASAGKKAFVVNRIGDLGFLLGMFTLFAASNTLSIDGLRDGAAQGLITPATATLGCLFLFLGAVGKSAQIPLYVWLPDAMAGPTPVSALIHAATMVTAGVYMIARLSFLFALSPVASAVVALIGGATALFAASIGITQRDIKKVLAYSTISQLGIMMVGVGVGAYFAGIFHLMTHAFFKACLFLGAGAVIHALSGEQDIMKMGGLRKKLPWTYWTFLISTLAISGFPPLSGFFSKDEILWKALSTDIWSEVPWASGWLHLVVYGFGLSAALVTSFYMFRLVFLTFHGSKRLDPKIHIHHESRIMSWPLMVLALLAILGGWVGASLFGIHGIENFLDATIVPAPESHFSKMAEWGAALLSIASAVAGLLIAFLLYIRKPELPKRWAERCRGLYRLVFNKYFVDEIYTTLVIRPVYYFSVALWKVVDEFIIDLVGVNGPAKLLQGIGGLGRKLQSGNIQVYAFWLFAGLCAAVFYLVYVGLFNP